MKCQENLQKLASGNTLKRTVSIPELKSSCLKFWKENRVLYDTVVAHDLIVFQGHMTNHDAQTAL